MNRLERIGGWTLVGATAGVLLAMSHHPTHLTQSGLGEAIHAIMICLVALTGFGYACFAIIRGADRPLILLGAVIFAIAVLADVVAAVTNGFVAAAIADGSADIRSLAWAANQAFAGLGVFATGGAMLSWSADLASGSGRAARATGLAGALAAILSIALLLFGAVRMNVAGALVVYGVQTLWSAALGLLMLSGGASADPSRPVVKRS